MTKQYGTLEGLKRAAVKLKRETGISHNAALERIARDAGFTDYHNAVQAYSALATGDDANEDTGSPLPSTEIMEMSPELAALLKHQRDLDIADAGPQADESNELYRGVMIESRWSIMHELATMRRMVDAMPDLVRFQLPGLVRRRGHIPALVRRHRRRRAQCRARGDRRLQWTARLRRPPRSLIRSRVAGR